jgi:uncharacterized protein YkwD
VFTPGTDAPTVTRACRLGLPALLVATLVAPACNSAAVQSSVPPQPSATALAGGPAFAHDTGCSGTAPAATNAAWEQQVIELVNQQRKANGLPPLKHVTSLTDAARWYAKDMVDDDYFGRGHDTYDRSGGRLVKVCAWSARIGAFYTGWNALGENIADGSSSPPATVSGWMGSSGHRANILNGNYWETGVGYRAGASYGHYWVQDFGRRSGVYPVVINDEAASTHSRFVNLYVYGRWNEIRIRNDDDAFGPWQPFTNTLAWTLASVDGLRTVNVEMRSGSTTVTASDTIALSQEHEAREAPATG